VHRVADFEAMIRHELRYPIVDWWLSFLKIDQLSRSFINAASSSLGST
jgi:hypothetical protein